MHDHNHVLNDRQKFVQCINVPGQATDMYYHKHVLNNLLHACMSDVGRQEGPEHHHKVSWQFVRLSFNGGAQGNPYAARLIHCGEYVKDGTKRWVYKRPVTMAVMDHQARLIHHDYHTYWPDDYCWPQVRMHVVK